MSGGIVEMRSIQPLIKDKRKIFGEQIRSRRLAKGWDQSELARKIGATATTVGRWENGKNIPTKSHYVIALKRELSFSEQDFREAFGVHPSSKDGAIRFDRFDAAASDMRSKVSELVETGAPIDIKWIGLTMEYGAPVLIDLVSELERHNLLGQWSVEIAMIDPDWRRVDRINPTWKTQLSANVERLIDSLPKDKSKVYFYDEAPSVHGFLINDRYLYESYCSWRKLGSKLRLFGGENPYEYFDIQEQGDPQWRGANFLGWLNYFKQRVVDY
jgi:transcriptional regulator with XRE-family HTH domain